MKDDDYREAVEARFAELEDRVARLEHAPGPPVAALTQAACSRCGAPMLFSARARGDGLCGPCSRAVTGTQTESERARAVVHAFEPTGSTAWCSRCGRNPEHPCHAPGDSQHVFELAGIVDYASRNYCGICGQPRSHPSHVPGRTAFSEP